MVVENSSKEASEIFEQVRGELVRVFEETPEVELAYLHGSVARKESGKLSDIDLAVYLENDCDFIDVKMRLISEISSLINDFDLIVLNSSRPLMAYNVVKHGVILLEKSRTMKAEIESSIIRKYLDMKPYLQRHAEEKLERYAKEGYA